MLVATLRWRDAVAWDKPARKKGTMPAMAIRSNRVATKISISVKPSHLEPLPVLLLGLPGRALIVPPRTPTPVRVRPPRSTLSSRPGVVSWSSSQGLSAQGGPGFSFWSGVSRPQAGHREVTGAASCPAHVTLIVEWCFGTLPAGPARLRPRFHGEVSAEAPESLKFWRMLPIAYAVPCSDPLGEKVRAQGGTQ